ncbi:diaminobutyrate--2-oxoglutarate transaminase [Alcaligenaceae bacterium]|nr:diaminobutyrate--2-oxoglutarate transaminase [Alcaligenaceae bacterium]
MTIFKKLESNVQSYARSFPVVFDRAEGAALYDTNGKRYIDFLAGAGTLNYGHNNPECKSALLDYIAGDGITHGLDMHTRAKAEFLEAFQQHILKPRNMNYKFQFTGPTGTNAVEAAMKLARKVTGRQNIIAFTNGFHGVSLGAAAATGNQHHRGGCGVSLGGVTRIPYDGYMGGLDSVQLLDKMLNDASSGVDAPAAVIVETVQGEGGLNVAGQRWLKSLEAVCRRHGMLLIVDDIQAGCGRTGTFFSFEQMGVSPDIVTLSKSLSGFGLPFAIVLMKPEYDRWAPGEHNGTFRGNNHAFITAKAAIDAYWRDDTFAREVQRKGGILSNRLARIASLGGSNVFRAKGRGMMQGIACDNGELAGKIVRRCFEDGLVIETSGPDSEVVKILCPLVISDEDLNAGLDILERSVRHVLTEELSMAA